MTRFTVVAVSYNTAALLARCLASILAQTVESDEVIVVDNASQDGSAALVREQFPSVRLIANERNAGFGAACNQAIEASSGRLILLVNPDCELEVGALDAFERFMDGHPDAGVAGGRLRYGDGRYQHSAFRFPTLAQVFLDYFPVNWRLTESSLNGRYPAALDQATFEIDHPLGALMCIRRVALEQTGSFDESFFMYVEEVDLCYRLKRARWRVWHVGDAAAIHLSGQSTRQRPGEMLVHLHRSRSLFYRKHYSLLFRTLARVLVWAGALKMLASGRAGPRLALRVAMA